MQQSPLTRSQFGYLLISTLYIFGRDQIGQPHRQAASNVDQKRRRLHQPKAAGVHQALRCRRVRDGHYHEVGLRQQFVKCIRPVQRSYARARPSVRFADMEL